MNSTSKQSMKFMLPSVKLHRNMPRHIQIGRLYRVISFYFKLLNKHVPDRSASTDNDYNYK